MLLDRSLDKKGREKHLLHFVAVMKVCMYVSKFNATRVLVVKIQYVPVCVCVRLCVLGCVSVYVRMSVCVCVCVSVYVRMCHTHSPISGTKCPSSLVLFLLHAVLKGLQQLQLLPVHSVCH